MTAEQQLRPGTGGPRARLLDGIPATEQRLELAGIRSAVLVGGDGPPVVLLHGPGESAVNWRSAIPALAQTQRVIAPDLPAHGSTEAPDELDADRVHAWLGELIDRTCDAPPLEESADDPPRDQPEAFLRALRAELGSTARRPLTPPAG